MGSSATTMIGCAVLVAFVAGYWIRSKGDLPPPAPKIAGIDLGTTFSSIGLYHPVTGDTTIVADDLNQKSIPSVVAFLPNGTTLVGHRAVRQQERNAIRTIYDAKRFIGRTFSPDNENFKKDQLRYPFAIKLDKEGKAYFEVPLQDGIRVVTPEEVGAIIIRYLKDAAERHLANGKELKQVVISVPAEFDEQQRNATARAVGLAGMEAVRVVSEPTAASLAYGLDKKKGVERILVVDLGGGTLDTSLLWLQGGVFVTQAMAGNNRLGGQDFNDRVQHHLVTVIHEKLGRSKEQLTKQELQTLRLEIERAKIALGTRPIVPVKVVLEDGQTFQHQLSRDEFERLNADLLKSIEEPISAALEDAQIDKDDIDEIVLVGGSTRLEAVRRLVGTYFGRAPNFGVDPELAVVTGAAVQAGVIGGGWPLKVAAIEMPTKRRKRHFYTPQQRVDEEGSGTA